MARRPSQPLYGKDWTNRFSAAVGMMAWLVECCFTSTETVRLLGTGSQDGHLGIHTALELWGCCPKPGEYFIVWRNVVMLQLCLLVGWLWNVFLGTNSLTPCGKYGSLYPGFRLIGNFRYFFLVKTSIYREKISSRSDVPVVCLTGS